MGYKDDVHAFRERILGMQNASRPLEIIEEEEIVSALIVLNLLAYHQIADVFLGCAAINLINRYVKQQNCKLNYQFKRHIINLLKGIEDIREPGTIVVGYDNSEGNAVLLISIWDFQFSYKSIRYSDQIKMIQGTMGDTWDGLRKQPYAKTIFQFAFESPYLSNKTLGDNDLKEKISEELALYRNGSYLFKDGKLLKVNDFEIHPEDMDFQLKNYIREKLRKCGRRPIIVSGVFVKVWDQHVTFIAIQPYIEGVKAFTICDHINIFRRNLESVISLDSLVGGKRYYLIGYCNTYGNGRFGIKLAKGLGFVPFFGIDEFEKMSKDIISKCYRFSIEEYISPDQGTLKL